MSYRNKPYRDKDRRSLLLEKESEKLRKEISELEDALILHTRFEGERDQSVRGLLRKEIGGSHWEHGAEGKLRTYRTHQDLYDGTQTYSRRNGKDAQHLKKGKQSDGKKRYTHKSTSKTIAPKSLLNDSPKKNTASLSLKSEPVSREKTFNTDLDINFLKVSDENQEKQSKSMSDEANSLKDLKSRVLAKATAKILSKPGHGGTSTFHHKKSSLDIQNTVQDNIVVTGNDRKDSGKVDILTVSKEDCGQQKSEERVREKTCLERNKSSCHSKHLSVVSKHADSKPVSQVSEEGLSSNPLKKDKDDKYSLLFEKTAKDLSESGGKKEEDASFKTVPFLDSSFSPFSFGISSNINTQTDFTNTNQTMIDKSTLNNEWERNEDINKDRLDSDPSKVKSPRIDKEVDTWLQNLGLHSTERYVDLFAHHQMDMASVKLLTATQLREMGIHALGPIMKIMKGVQILGRRNSLDDGAHNKTQENKCDEDKVSEDSKSSHMNFNSSLSSQMFAGADNGKSVKTSHQKEVESGLITSSDKYDKKPRSRNSLTDRRAKVQKPVTSVTTPNEKRVVLSAKAGWKETFDEAEFLNLNNRSLITGLDGPSVTAVKEKQNQAKDTSSQKKNKVKNTNSKVSRKPPQIATNGRANGDGVTSAAQRYIEKQKLQQQKDYTEGRATARRREVRDEMAARHHGRRRSSSLDRCSSPSNHRPTSLQRSSSFTEKVKRNTERELPQGDLSENVTLIDTDLANVKEDISTKHGKKRDNEELDGTKVNDTIALLKDFPEDGSKHQDDNKVLTLGVVRQLKKQLNDLEQHLVQTQDNSETISRDDHEKKVNNVLNVPAAEEELSVESHSEHMNGSKNVCNQETLQGRLSARERRRNKMGIKARENKDNKELDSSSMSSSYETHTAPTEKNMILSMKSEHHGSDQPSLNETPFETVFTSKENSRLPYSLPKKASFNVIDSEANITEVFVSGKQNFTHYEDGFKTQGKPSHIALKSQRLSRINRPQQNDFEDRLRKIEIDYQDLSYENKDILGEGVFSQVFKGSYQGSQVALKLLRAPLLSADKNYFSAEVSLLQELRHPCVVMLLGVCTSNPRPIMVLELMEGGNLFARLQNHSLPCLAKSEIYQISHDVASGVCYLHHHRPPVLHLDMKSRNVLLGHGNHAKVADFGFSKLKHEADIKISRASKPKALSGSPAWMAPELLAAGEITAKADVYSYAIVLWEMITREIPYDGLSMFQILEHVRLNCRPKLPSGYPQKLTDLITKCWEPNPAARPGFKDILKSLDTVFSTSEWIARPAYSQLGGKEANPCGNAEDEIENSAKKADEADRMSEMDVKADKWENIDVKSISSEDMEHSECDNGEDVHIDVNDAKNKNTININDSHVQNNSVSRDNDFFDSKSQQKPEERQMPPNELHSSFPTVNKMANLPDISPRLVPSPRIREMAKKQAVERSSSIFWSQSFDQSNEITNKAVTPRLAAAFPHEDSELETLIKKYLPSPRNKSLMRGTQPADYAKVTERLLPLRQSLDKPKKPPKPKKMQSMSVSSQSLNFDRPAASCQGAVAKGPKESQSNPQQNKLDENTKESLQPVGQAAISEVKNVMGNQSGNVLQKSFPSMKLESPSLRYPRPKTTTSLLTLQEDPQVQSVSIVRSSIKMDDGSTNILKHHMTRDENLETFAHSFNALDSENVLNAFATTEDEDSTHSKVERDGAYDTKNSFDDYPESKDVRSSRDDVQATNNASNSGLVTKSAIPSDKSQKSLPFLLELQEKSQTLKNEITPVDEKLNLSSENKEAKFHDSSVTHLHVEKLKQTPSKHSANLSFQSHLLDVEENIHSDSESSICTEFSADSLSITLSDDADSIGSLDEIGSRQRTKKLSKKRSKRNSKSMDGSLLRNETPKKDAPHLHVTQSFYEPQPETSDVRESFFLFDDFQLTSDASKNTSQIGDIKCQNEVLDTSCSDINKSKIDEAILNPNALGIIGRQMDQSFSKSQLHNQENYSKDNKRSIKSRKPHHSKTNKEHQMTMPIADAPHHSKKSNSAHFMKIGNQNNDWPAPPLSKDEPGVRPVKTVQFSLEASMLIKQKSQLKSVAVQGETSLVEMKKDVRRSLSSVASILKKAIEERRFAMGDNLESQDMTPEASWSIQDEDV